MLFLFYGCGPSGSSYSTKQIGSGGVFPYFRSDSTYTSYLCIFNSSEYKIDAKVVYRDKTGATAASSTETLEPFASVRLTQSNFTGSVSVDGSGEDDALHCQLEMRKNNGAGVALAEPACSAGYVWFYYLDVKDDGPGKERTTVVTYNFSSTQTIYVTYGWGDVACCYSNNFEVSIPPLGFYSFQPYTVSKTAFEGVLYAGANSGSKQSGQQLRCHGGALFYESSTDIALNDFKPPHFPYASAPSYPKGYENWYKMYIPDVQDDGASRADRIHLKLNTAANYNAQKYITVPIYFYDQKGKAVTYATLNPVKLLNMFDTNESYQSVSPMKLLGSSFSGSVFIDNPYWDSGKLQASVSREAPGQWKAMSDYSPPGGSYQGKNCLPYVSNAETGWIYQVVLLYPGANLSVSGTPPKDAPATFSGPTVTLPTASGGYVYLKFFEMDGTYKGALAYKMTSNQTLLVNLSDSAVTKYLSDFKGALVIEPRDVVVQLELRDKNKSCFASTGNWYSMKGY
jgi:hypothetical protein